MATAKIIELNETNTCKICDNALARYSCPKCNILYCSLNCYQSNSHLECSESFYKDNILTELNIDKNSEESRTKMLEILQRCHENNKILPNEQNNSDSEYSAEDLDLGDFEGLDDLDSDDEPDYVDIAERLAGVNLDDAEQVWDKLTEDEKQDFVAFLKSEDVTKLIPSWQPWWLYYKDSKVEDTSEEQDYKSSCPKICSVKDFSQITTKTPSECVKYNLVNIMASYVFTTRYFNGEHFDFAKEAVSCIISLSLTLKAAQNFEDYEMAVKSVEQECINSDWIVTDAENIQTMRDDLEKVFRGPKKSESKFYLMCALSDLHNLLNDSLKPNEETQNSNFSKKFPNEHFPAVKLENDEKIVNCIKKVDYYLSYTKDCYST